MKEIDYYIEINTKLYEEAKKKYLHAKDKNEKIRFKSLMENYKYYVIGLKDAKDCIINDIEKYLEV